MVLRQIGKYEILGSLGRGGMGEVYRARDPVLGREVALKTIAGAAGGNEEFRRRFYREARSVGSLSHPNIVTVYDFGEEQGRLFMTMELLAGRDLKELIQGRTPVSLDSRLAIMEQICEGVAFAHARGVVHRDIKPANIHVLPGGWVKIIDFGLARPASSDVTRQGTIIGTPHYMSPEQVRGDVADARSDVFSLGAVFYELLASRKPFDAPSVHAVLLLVVEHQPEPLRKVAPHIPPMFDEVLERTMAKEPARRYRHAGEMREALRQLRVALRPEELELRVPPAAPEAAPLQTGEEAEMPALSATVVTCASASALPGLPAGEPVSSPPPDDATMPALLVQGMGGREMEALLTHPAAPTGWRRTASLTGAVVLLAGILLTSRLTSVPGAGGLRPDRGQGQGAAGPVSAVHQPSLSRELLEQVIERSQAVAREVDRVVAGVQGALDAGDVQRAAQGVTRLVELRPGHAALPAFAVHVDLLLRDRAEEAKRHAVQAELAALERDRGSSPAFRSALATAREGEVLLVQRRWSAAAERFEQAREGFGRAQPARRTASRDRRSE